MVKINGVEATNLMADKTNKKNMPTLNEILDRMEANYCNMNSQPDRQVEKQSIGKNFGAQSNQKFEKNQNSTFWNGYANNQSENSWNDYAKSQSNGSFEKNDLQQASAQQNSTASEGPATLQDDDKSNLILSILPSLLSGNKTHSLGKEQNILMKELLKNTHNPKLAKLFELLPKLTTAKASTASAKRQNVREEPSIDSFKRIE